VVFEAAGDIPRFEPDVELTLFRIAQEAINNALKHAQPTRVQLSLKQQPAGIELAIRDNGRGFDAAHTKLGFGLTGIHERAALIGAQVTLTSRPTQGTSLIVHLPCAA
jgi:signal transduction histidine kinase